MHNHDHDLIFSVANAELEGSALDDATAQIAGCAECSAELELQRSGAELLAAVATPSLAINERNTLRSNLQEQLGLVAPEPVAPAPRPRGIRNWGPIAVAAVALTGVVFVAPQLGLLGGSSDTEDFTASAATTVASQAETTPDVQSLSSADSAGALKDESASTTAAAAAPAETIASATAEAIDGQAMYFFEELTVEDLEALQADPSDTTHERALVPTTSECADFGLGEFDAETATPLAVGAFEGVDAIAIVYDIAGTQESIIAIHDAMTCEVLASTR